MEDNTILEVDDRLYVNPQTGLDESQQFIETLRNVQGENTAQINQNTYNLGSQVPSNIGGLTGSEGLWQAQYQTPQTEAQIANLRATAQAEALNTATSNLQSILNNQYKQALRNFYKRQSSKNPGNTPTDNTSGNIKTETVLEGTPGNINADGSINAVVSLPGATATAQDNYAQYTNDAGETVRQYKDGRIEVIKEGKVVETTRPSTRGSVKETIQRLHGEGKKITNKTISADKDGNVVLNWTDNDGRSGSETVKVDINYRGTGIF